MRNLLLITLSVFTHVISSTECNQLISVLLPPQECLPPSTIALTAKPGPLRLSTLYQILCLSLSHNAVNFLTSQRLQYDVFAVQLWNGDVLSVLQRLLSLHYFPLIADFLPIFRLSYTYTPHAQPIYIMLGPWCPVLY